MKPVQSGAIENRAPDLETVLQIANINPTPDLYPLMCPYMLKKAASPHLAARLENKTISIDHIVAQAHALSKQGFLCIEGCGGLLVPINQHETMFDLLQALPLPIIVVARGGLGTINHTLLTLNLLKTQVATYRSVGSSIANQSGSDLDLSREPPLTSSRSEPFQSPIESQQTDRWQLRFKNNQVVGIIINDTYKPTDTEIRQDNPKIIASFANIPILADLNFGEKLNEHMLETIISTLA